MSRGRPWTHADTFELRRLASQGLTIRAIAERMGRGRAHIADRADRHGIDVRRVIKRKKWPAGAEETLVRLFPTHSAAEIAAEIGVKVATVHNRARLLGLRKARDWKAARTTRRWLEGRHEGSRSHHFAPGHVPHNRGVPQSEWLPDPGRGVETRFRKGRPATAARNYIPIGGLRVTKDDTLERKVTDDPRLAPARRWVSVARLVWEAAHGPIPPKHVVRFKDGMHTAQEAEITPDRLECISMSENMARNSYHNYPAPIPQIIQLRGALNRKINNRTRKHEEATP